MKKSILHILSSILVAAALVLGTGTGCQSPQKTTYTAVAATSVSVEAALKAYDVFAAQGRTTVEQNRQVKAAFEKYQKAFAVVCDAGAIYAASNTTNSPPASAALQQAIVNANQNIADLIELVRSFGVKI